MEVKKSCVYCQHKTLECDPHNISFVVCTKKMFLPIPYLESLTWQRELFKLAETCPEYVCH